MSDLAPFVAATIRDKVVLDQMDENQNLKEEIEELKRKLRERDPRRLVELKFAKIDYVLTKDTVHMTEVRRRRGRDFLLLFSNRGREDDRPGILLNDRFRLNDIPKLELWIDGACAIRFQELQYHYSSYAYLTGVEDWGGNYAATLCAKKGQDFRMEIEVIGVPPDEHAELLERESPVDFPPPDDPESPNYNLPYHRIGDNHRMYRIESVDRHVGHDQRISTERLMECLGEKTVYVPFIKLQCTKEFFNRKLTVPFDPQH